MRRTLQRGARARLSFPGEPHASVNMTNSMQLLVGRLFLVPRKRGDESPEELLRFSKTWRTKCSAVVQRIKLTFPAFLSVDVHFFHTIHHVYRSVWLSR